MLNLPEHIRADLRVEWPKTYATHIENKECLHNPSPGEARTTARPRALFEKDGNRIRLYARTTNLEAPGGRCKSSSPFSSNSPSYR